jgi:hypothetical protein
MDRRERLFMQGTLRQCVVSIGPRGLVLGRSEATLARGAGLSDAAGCVVFGGPNEILQPSFNVEQLLQPFVVGFVNEGFSHPLSGCLRHRLTTGQHYTRRRPHHALGNAALQ